MQDPASQFFHLISSSANHTQGPVHAIITGHVWITWKLAVLVFQCSIGQRSQKGSLPLNSGPQICWWWFFPFCLRYGLHAVKSHLFYRTVLGALTNTQGCNLHRNQDPELPSPHQPVSPAALLGQPRPTLGSWHPLICFPSLQLCLGRVSHKSGHTTRGLLKNPAISFMFGCAGSLLRVRFSRCGERGCSPAVRLNLLIVVASAAGEHGLGDGASVAAVPGL